MIEDKDFEKQFYNNIKFVKNSARIILAVWVAGVIASLTVLGLVIYVAVHFISKYW